MAGLVRNRMSEYQRIPSPGGEDAAQASSIYQERYGELPMPATRYATSEVPLYSTDVVPSTPTRESNASVVNRVPRFKGMRFLGGILQRKADTPQMYISPYSSKFQDMLVGPHPNVQWNDGWYIAYPAASVMNGGLHNLALSERVPQLVTRQSGGPGPTTTQMGPAPRFSRVQKIPRYSTLPQTYPTTASPA